MTEEKKSKRHRITKKQKQILEALSSTMGNVTLAIEVLKQQGIIIDRSTHYHAMRSNDKYAEAVQHIMDENLDIAEGKLLTAVNKGDMKAVQYFLDSKGQDRGYGRKVELRGSATDPVRVQQTTAAEIEEARQNLKEHFQK